MRRPASNVTPCCIRVTSAPFVSVEQECRGLLMLEANTKQENNPPLGGGNEAQRVERQADIAETKACYDDTICAN